MERMVSTQNLKVGMYVSSLDRPWLDTPFPMQGYYIKDQTDIDELKKYCKYLFIDVSKGCEAEVYLDEPAESEEHYVDDFLEGGERKVEYTEQKQVLQEFPVAEAALDEASIQVGNIMDNLRKGDNLDIQALKTAVQPMLDSIIRNADALLWMLSAHESQSLYRQASDNCAVTLAFGRHLGLYKEDLRTLATGMLLLDVGKLKISPAILNKPGALTKAEFTVVQKHVEFGVGMLETAPGLNDAVIDMVQTHHERYDGSGYPDGLEGRQIPLFGLIAGLIDTYNAMTRKTVYRDAIAPHKVLQELYKWRNKSFHGELVEQFLQCLGVYPTGSLVEMTSGEVGIVIAQNTRDRLRPTLSMLLDENKKPYDVKSLVDLSTVLTGADGLPLKILRALKPGSYGIDASAAGLR